MTTKTTTAAPDDEPERHLSTVADSAMASAIAKAELDAKVLTARAHPRVIRTFIDDCTSLATLDEGIAEECMYAIPREGKTISGPSARFAEIVMSCWGNCRGGARVIEEGREFITAQGVFHDFQHNTEILYEVRRRITDKYGRRYSADMIGVTGNAACSIALRNAVLKGVPKAFWVASYGAARKCAVGDASTLANRRADALAYLQKLGATEEAVLQALKRGSVEEITLDDLATLRGTCTAIKDGDITVEEAFPTLAPKPAAKGKTRTEQVGDKLEQEKK